MGALVLAVLLCLLPARAAGQVIDARLIPPGALRVSFSPDYQVWNSVYDENGQRQRLGRYLSGPNSADIFPSLNGPEVAVRLTSGDTTYRLSAGTMTTTVDADVRHFPLDFSLGLTRWLTLNASLPIVVTRARAHIAFDSTGANAGWNQATAEARNSTGLSQITALLADVLRAADDITARIAAGSYCPGASCITARALASDLYSFRSILIGFTGVSSSRAMPPLAPLAGSTGGAAIVGRLASLNARLAALGVSTITGTLPLPTSSISTEDVMGIVTGTAFGYEAKVPAYTKRARIGDVEVGARLGVLQSGPVRLVLTGSARLPTGNRDFADNLVDIGTGDRQLDITGGVEAAAGSGTISLTAGAWYTLQTAGPFIRRITPATHPLALASTTANVNRNLGEMIALTASPALQLTQGFRVHGLVSYFHKGADHFADLGSTPAGLSPSVLDSLTAMRSLTLGGGLAYTMNGGKNGLPMDAGMNYARTISGSGGFVPVVTTVSMYLKAYYKLW